MGARPMFGGPSLPAPQPPGFGDWGGGSEGAPKLDRSFIEIKAKWTQEQLAVLPSVTQ